jgi:NADH-quinone oxidoreductase subunit F
MALIGNGASGAEVSPDRIRAALMNYRQLLDAAAAGCSDLNKSHLAKIYIASSLDNPAATDIFKTIQTEIIYHDIAATAIRTGSFGYYDLEPLVVIDAPGKPISGYHNATAEKAASLAVDYHNDKIPRLADLAFCRLQNRIALRNCGLLDPANLGHYILLRRGYEGLHRALQMSPRDAIEEIKRSGLRGRRGAGFRVADKWMTCHESHNGRKYVICNAVEGDPQARTAWLLFESDPHSVLEGMLIAARAVDASRGIICINADYVAAIKNLENTLDQMRRNSLLGAGILDSSFSFEMTIKRITAALVSGEESALMRCLEGRQPMPYLLPPFPASVGFSGNPTLIHNSETLSNVSAVFQNNPEWFSGSGTKVITLSANAFRKYTLEIPLGISLRSVVENIEGHCSESWNLKAVQFGGPTGFFISADSLDIPIGYEMPGQDFMMGSGTIRVFGRDSCAVDMVRDTLIYIQQQSCGQCVFCREGSHQAVNILRDISENRGRPQDLDLLVELAEAMKLGSICGHGKTASNPILSGIRLFRSEFDAHIWERRCPASERSQSAN